ncbi:MAG: polysaccharide deacetylase family protein [Candidatus Andersenbacteria bacterium]|nr:polysaccharide deacetylase family protein [Candidatus Andersenbacteria bacterium]
MKTRGHITFVFDDGYEAVWQHVLPLLKEHNIPAVFAIPLENKSIANETGAPMRAWQQWQEVGSQHEIAAHSVTHRDLTSLSPSELQTELRAPAQTLMATTLVYPGGGFNEEVTQEASKHYTAGRTVKRGFETIPPAHPMALKTFNFSRRNFSVTKANALALYAWATDKWLIETYHIVDTAPHQDIHSLPLALFAKHLAFVAHLPIAKITIQEALS